MLKTKKEKIYAVLIALVVLVIAGILFSGLRGSRGNTKDSPVAEPTERVVTREVERLVEVERVITADILRDGLRDMGMLITEEYGFTEVVGFSSVKKLLRTDIELGFTESSFLASYDGTVTAGADFGAVSVVKDEAAKHITVHVPHAGIKSVDVDPNSFVLYSEKTGLGNPLSAADFNQSLVELENSTREKALARGILERADENARRLIETFVGGLVDPSVYSLEVVIG